MMHYIWCLIWITVGAQTRYSAQTEKWLARNENEPFWQWFVMERAQIVYYSARVVGEASRA